MDPSSIPPHPSSTFRTPISLFPCQLWCCCCPHHHYNHCPHHPLHNFGSGCRTSNAVSTQLAAPIANHPPYFKMIYTTIEALKEKNGPSKRATAKYIRQAHPNLPLTHPIMLTYHFQC